MLAVHLHRHSMTQIVRLHPEALDKLVTIAERACIVHDTLLPAVPIKIHRV